MVEPRPMWSIADSASNSTRFAWLFLFEYAWPHTCQFVFSYTKWRIISAEMVRTTINGTCSPTCLMAARIQPPTPTVTVTLQWWSHLLVADQPETGAEFIIQHRDKRFTLKQTRATKRLKLGGVMDKEEKHPDGDTDRELHGNQLSMTERVAATSQSGAIWMSKVIERIIACDNLKLPVSPPARMSAPHTPQRAGQCAINDQMPPIWRRVDLSDE